MSKGKVRLPGTPDNKVNLRGPVVETVSIDKLIINSLICNMVETVLFNKDETDHDNWSINIRNEILLGNRIHYGSVVALSTFPPYTILLYLSQHSSFCVPKNNFSPLIAINHNRDWLVWGLLFHSSQYLMAIDNFDAIYYSCSGPLSNTTVCDEWSYTQTGRSVVWLHPLKTVPHSPFSV